MKPNVHDRMVKATMNTTQRAAFADASRRLKAGFRKSGTPTAAKGTRKRPAAPTTHPGGPQAFRRGAKLDASQIIDRRRN